MDIDTNDLSDIQEGQTEEEIRQEAALERTANSSFANNSANADSQVAA